MRQYADAVNLNILCFDFVESCNELRFLEANPDGQWGWLGDEDRSVRHVAEALCRKFG